MAQAPQVNIIGAGLAGSEAAWQAAKLGVKVDLYEMRPLKMTPAHHSDQFAELVCTNSLRADQLTNAAGLLKAEMRQLDSVIMRAADHNAVPAGGALAVDRKPFSAAVTAQLEALPNVTVHHQEVTALPQTGTTVIATGPLTAAKLAEQIQALTQQDSLAFYDAAAPILDQTSLDFDKIYLKSRYDQGDAAYLNCPLDREQFATFYQALLTAETANQHEFEKGQFFDGCLPLEVMAKRGEKTLLFGPMKPVGLTDPRTGKRPYAVVQLRQDDAAASLYNMVGFQTHLKWGEQKRVFQLIPGLEHARFVRYGVMHRNTFMRSPTLLQPTYQLKQQPNLLFAGQMTGVEGYIESAASGLIAGLNAARLAQGLPPLTFPQATMMGAMAHYITHTSAAHFQPMNANFGILAALPEKVRNKQARRQAQAERALATLAAFMPKN